jgi:hypothetical protein
LELKGDEAAYLSALQPAIGGRDDASLEATLYQAIEQPGRNGDEQAWQAVFRPWGMGRPWAA